MFAYLHMYGGMTEGTPIKAPFKIVHMRKYVLFNSRWRLVTLKRDEYLIILKDGGLYWVQLPNFRLG